MSPAILIAGATGNTGRSLFQTLPSLLQNTPLSNHRVLALTRSANNPVAQEQAKIPGIELIEQNRVEIDDAWLREHESKRRVAEVLKQMVEG